MSIVLRKLTIPQRETVAGEALSMLCGSKMILQYGDMGKRSPFANVSVRLSSSTEFKFSIHSESTGPSKTSQMCSPLFVRKVLRHKAEKMPSVLSNSNA